MPRINGRVPSIGSTIQRRVFDAAAALSPVSSPRNASSGNAPKMISRIFASHSLSTCVTGERSAFFSMFRDFPEQSI
jgi:hypothetical protein